ncbi:hypothetical protein [Lacihabitans soyangensis]|uniref:Uncharacterized protein n=1 Tax=Lacihabitans soyangensis TaxID=869394 RepID=A0AAE3H8H8_9BACT|nr:hypothetical protein [Lacihabitans soyangensis]MCP9765165.1 hypothetical protein [Lacihabitans soyangensis]
MNLQETIDAINDSSIKLEQIPDAKTLLENEIAACEDVIQDPETEFHMRAEYHQKMKTFKKLLNRI